MLEKQDVREQRGRRGREGGGGEATLTPCLFGGFVVALSPTSWKPAFTGASSKFTQLIPSGSRWAL